ncbi:MAG: hypothetical protein QOK30_3496 [Nocardioidaceae bacterium]|jgi:ATP phosphoribosyltransferase|nr:hypothetical protein [Nocardioidaceae bacterium]
MAEIGNDGHIEVDHDGEAVCSAEVSLDEATRAARVSLHAESGHLPTGARERLVDEVLELPQIKNSEHVSMSVPRGDAESLTRLQQRCDHMTVRPAGSTVIVEVDKLSDHDSVTSGAEPPEAQEPT